jgi:deoxyribose-phosphate aldolase
MALRCLDLTSLNATDTAAGVQSLCRRAQTRFGSVAAVCVWPRFVSLARSLLPPDIQVAAVANFPDGALDTAAALADLKCIVDAGGNEIDLVLPYRALLRGQTPACADFLVALRDASRPLTLKVIVESGELKTTEHVVLATQLAISAGADFVKTSTGKTPVSATPEAARQILQTIAASGQAQVGFKASGGIRSVRDAAVYIELTAKLLGHAAVSPKRLRLGASSLLDDIEAVLSGQSSCGSGSGY